MFWSLTPHEFFLLNDRAQTKLELQDFLVARIESLLANIHRDTKQRKEPFTPKDFMVTRQERVEETPNDTEQMLKQIEFLTELFGGSNERERQTES